MRPGEGYIGYDAGPRVARVRLAVSHARQCGWILGAESDPDRIG
jgi:hypothetical protein